MSHKAPFSLGRRKGGEDRMLISKVKRSRHLIFERVGLWLAVQVVASPPGSARRSRNDQQGALVL